MKHADKSLNTFINVQKSIPAYTFILVGRFSNSWGKIHTPNHTYVCPFASSYKCMMSVWMIVKTGLKFYTDRNSGPEFTEMIVSGNVS